MSESMTNQFLNIPKFPYIYLFMLVTFYQMYSYMESKGFGVGVGPGHPAGLEQYSLQSYHDWAQ